ncbi:MICAL-like protein 1 [Solea solea]|uniref:MICAL-like protein 1 n=1 Tax=Solea solea TaxID=90069 RepID=UPI00272ACC8A|nr:MICAL-like protein 1 [Solea solea]
MSDHADILVSPRVLRDWCRVTCATYPTVKIKNMSTSFRDGLAFCAIIHKHRPDLIDFSSLSEDNVYQNNNLAFQVAQTKLGIPALLDPKEMVSCEVPDCLSIITYLSHFYCVFFSRKSPCAGFVALTRSTSSDGSKPLKSLTHLETDHLSNTRPQTVCALCLKPVHLIQRHLVDGKVYHCSCFRCKVCHNTLLPEFYKWGSDVGSLICTFHKKDIENTHVDHNQQIRSTENHPRCNFQAGNVLSLSGLVITSVPHYTKKTESQDRPVYKTPEMEGKEKQKRISDEKSSENRDSTAELKTELTKPAPPDSLLPSDKDRTDKGSGKAGSAPILEDGRIQEDILKNHPPSSSCVQGTEGGGRVVPAPRKKSESSSVFPVPAPKTKTFKATSGSAVAGNPSNQRKSSLCSSCVTSPTVGVPKVQINHPWKTIIHPGPWTQLPPAPAPVPAPRTKFVSKMRESQSRPRMVGPNPFDEHMHEDTQGEAESKTQTMSSVGAGLTEDSSRDTTDSGDAKNTDIKSNDNHVNPLDEAIPTKRSDYKEAGAAISARSEGVTAVSNTVETPSEHTSQISSPFIDENRVTRGSHVTEDEEQSHCLPRSVSVPVIPSAHSHGSSVPVGPTGEHESVASCQSKLAYRENPFDRKPSMTKSKTFQAPPSRRTSAPGHGFPIIKRKVKTDECVSIEDLRTEMRQLEERLDALQDRGVELETNLRDCKDAKKEERMLMEWFSVLHDKQVLVRRDAELVHLTNQQKLEERQTDVEYELRCLLNKPEKDWSEEDRSREQQLMDELVAIIEQRNQIISSLEQDRQREREEDGLSEAFMKNKEFQKEGLKELKKSKKKLKPTHVFKMLNHKADTIKSSMGKKS